MIPQTNPPLTVTPGVQPINTASLSHAYLRDSGGAPAKVIAPISDTLASFELPFGFMDPGYPAIIVDNPASDPPRYGPVPETSPGGQDKDGSQRWLRPSGHRRSSGWSKKSGTRLASHAHGQQADPAKIAELQGELGVQLGASDTQTAAELSLTGRYLIHVLDAGANKSEAAHSQWRKEKQYGLAWAAQSPDTSQGQPSGHAPNGTRV